MNAIGKNTWLFPDMFWPSVTAGSGSVSHEAICVLNTSKTPATITLTLFYEDKEPVENLQFTCCAMRTLHIRMDELRNADGQPIARGVGYAGMVQSDVPVVVQYTRVDASQPELALMTTMGYAL